MKKKGLGPKTVISPEMGEWISGLPCGWTSEKPLPAKTIAKVKEVMSSSRNRTQLSCLECFCGVGGESLGLSKWFTPVAYVEKHEPCRCVLQQQRMEEGVLHRAPLFGDIKEVTMEILMKEGIPRPDTVAGGFPCKNISCAGNQLGLDGECSSLFYEMTRIATEYEPPVKYLWFENVGNIVGRSMKKVWKKILRHLHELGYDGKWLCIKVSNVAGPCVRKRWFLICTHRSAHGTCPLPCPGEKVFEAKDLMELVTKGCKHFNPFNSMPPPHCWMIHKRQYSEVEECMKMLSNIAVPAQVTAAGRLLSGTF